MALLEAGQTLLNGLPPYGGSGLKYYGSEMVYNIYSLPPYGGSGLKYQFQY